MLRLKPRREELLRMAMRQRWQATSLQRESRHRHTPGCLAEILFCEHTWVDRTGLSHVRKQATSSFFRSGKCLGARMLPRLRLLRLYYLHGF